MTRKLINRSAANRTISKQEAMILLSGLDLVKCSDVIETVSLSGSYRISTTSNTTNTIVNKYAKRDLDGPEGQMSLDQFYRHTRKRSSHERCMIPHYVGGRSVPVFPVTEGYARSILKIYKPWHASDSRDDGDGEACIAEFEAFLASVDCPKTVTIPYERAKSRYFDKTTHVEKVSEAMVERPVAEDDTETRELLDIVATFQEGVNPDDAMSQYRYYRGENYDWGKKKVRVSAEYE